MASPQADFIKLAHERLQVFCERWKDKDNPAHHYQALPGYL